MLRNLFLLISLSVSVLNFAQELPPISTYTSQDYKADNQNWSIAQSENNFIYASNNKGLLEFNGFDWKLYPTPNGSASNVVRVLKDKIYTGFKNDFGFWDKNDFGELFYTSIVKSQNIKILAGEEIETILALNDWILFKSSQNIYLFNLKTSEVKVINTANKIQKISKVNGVIYFQEENKGIFKIEKGVPKLFAEHQILQENVLVEIFNKDDTLLFLTQNNGFFYLENKRLKKWKIASEAILKNVTVTTAKNLANKDFALGTVSDGFLYLNKNGDFKYQITKSSGLNSNTLHSIFEDANNNIWLSLNNGINCINNTSPFKIFNRKTDFIGSIYSSIVFKDNLYLGTNQGLFYREATSKESFTFIENTEGTVLSLENIDGTLFCGHTSGTLVVKNNKASFVFKEQGTLMLKKVAKNLILQGGYDGLHLLEKNNNTWRFRNKVTGFDNSIKSFVISDSHKIIVNLEYKGVFKLTLDDDYQNVIDIQKEKSLAKSLHSCLLSYQDKIIFSSKDGVFIYDKNKDVFKRDAIFSQLISENGFISAELIPTNSNKLWSFSKESIKYLTQGELSSKPVVKSIPISASMPKATYGYENIVYLENQNYLIGTSNGYVAVDLNKYNDQNNYKIQIYKVNNFDLATSKLQVDLSEKKDFSSKDNNFEFFYGVPNYDKTTSIKYQYFINGLNENWSNPSTAKSFLLEEIPYGNYTFKVRALVDGQVKSNEASFNFVITKPWYLSNGLLLIFGLFLAVFVLTFYIVNKKSNQHFKKQQEALLAKAKKESELREFENKQKVIKLKKEKLEYVTETKTRELATSAKNIIKKNDFLNKIKAELINGDPKNVSKVIDIIDKNLNNTEDWEMFQEAFNNADKNFIKKVKVKQPTLTPNDIRLCVYLRLNLSSKEIAPLLNISSRSVEVKRYRLRKKMQLSHDANLRKYILEI